MYWCLIITERDFREHLRDTDQVFSHILQLQRKTLYEINSHSREYSPPGTVDYKSVMLRRNASHEPNLYLPHCSRPHPFNLCNTSWIFHLLTTASNSDFHAFLFFSSKFKAILKLYCCCLPGSVSLRENDNLIEKVNK